MKKQKTMVLLLLLLMITPCLRAQKKEPQSGTVLYQEWEGF